MSNLLTATYDSVPEGSNLAVPAHEILDTQARYIQDGWLFEVGMLRRRGKVGGAASVAALPKKGCGLAQAVDPAGVTHVAALNGDVSTANFSVLSQDYSTWTNLGWNGTLPQAPYYAFDAKPALNAGTLIGTSKRNDAQTPVQTLGLWRGADKANYTTGTLNVTRGGTVVTGIGTSWVSFAAPGMFLFAVADDPAGTTVYIGSVKSVDSATQVTLEAASGFTCTGKTYTLQSVRGICPKYVGFATTDTTNANVVGQNTKFLDNELNSGDWRLYRATDFAYIGKVSSVTNNTLIVLTGNSGVALNAERFVALKATGNYSLDTQASPRKPGFLSAVYAERQWYANNAALTEKTTRLWFSDPTDFEALDISENDGDFITVTSGRVGVLDTPILGLAPCANSLLVLKENETYAVFGSTPDQFTLNKVGDDGTLSGMSVQQVGGGAIWAGREGIYIWDGTSPENLVGDRLGDAYKQMVKNYDTNNFRMWSMLDRDHYVLFIESVNTPYSIRKGNVKTTPTRLTISIYLPNRAVTFVTNCDIRGSVTLPSATGKGTWFLVNDSSVGHVCSSLDLFDTLGPDTITCDGNAAGPDFYMESKRYNLGDALLKKLWKQIAVHYYAAGDDLVLDTVVGLNEDGTTSLSRFLKTIIAWNDLGTGWPTWDGESAAFPIWDSIATPRFVVKRIKFLKRSQHIAFRLYQASSSMTSAKIGPWALGYKPQRPGRI